MRLFSKTVLTLAALVTMGAPIAQASVFKWQAEDRSVSVTFPDSWARINNQKPDDILTISAPMSNARAICKISAMHDPRFVIYPISYARSIQRTYVSTPMWLPLVVTSCLLYTSDAADDSLRVDLGGRRIIKKKATFNCSVVRAST